MSKFKCRCWDDKNKKWLFGYEYPNLGGFSFPVGEVVLGGELNSISLDDWEHVITELYAGFNDKNNDEIYENDLLKDERGNTFRVYRLRGCLAIKALQWATDKSDLGIGDDLILMPLCDNQTYGYIKEQCEVIGNIHENLELLQ